MKDALLKLMNQVTTLAPSAQQSSAGDRLGPFILHTGLTLSQSLTVGQGSRTWQRTERSSCFQSALYFVGLLFVFFFLSFFFFNHYLVVKEKTAMQEKRQSSQEETLLKGDLLIRPLKRSRRSLCLEFEFIPAHWTFVHKYQSAIFACIFTDLCFVSGCPLCGRVVLR